MSKHIVEGFITYEKHSWQKTPTISWTTYDPSNLGWTEAVAVCPHSIEVDVPDDFNPVPQMVAALEEQKRQERLKLAQKLAELDEKISKLTCITNEVTA
jgi:hypothetical protein